MAMSLPSKGCHLSAKPSPPRTPSKSTESAGSIDEDQSHLSNSSAKQQSFETKSMASVTTFAMDEKESIRPDDSASVRAVDDDDLASTVSRNTSFQQESSVIMPTLRGGAGVPGPPIAIAARRYPTMVNPPRFGDLEPPPAPRSQGRSDVVDGRSRQSNRRSPSFECHLHQFHLMRSF